MKKIVRLTESDLVKLVKRVVNEQLPVYSKNKIDINDLSVGDYILLRGPEGVYLGYLGLIEEKGEPQGGFIEVKIKIFQISPTQLGNELEISKLVKSGFLNNTKQCLYVKIPMNSQLTTKKDYVEVINKNFKSENVLNVELYNPDTEKDKIKDLIDSYDMETDKALKIRC